MTINDKLKLIGFTEFIHLKKDKRDGHNRVFFTSKYNNDWFLIKLIMKKDNWEIEKINGNDEFMRIFKNNKLEEIIYFFKTYYYANHSISAYL